MQAYSTQRLFPGRFEGIFSLEDKAALNKEPASFWKSMGMKIGSVVIDCKDFDKMMAFWQGALRYVPGRPPDGGFVILKDPSGNGPNVSVNLKDRPMIGPKHPGWRLSEKIRMHLDLYADDQEAEVERLLKLGARMVHRPGKDHDYIILADPEGNHFCVIDLHFKG